MDEIFRNWSGGSVNIRNVVSVITHRIGYRMKNTGNAEVYQLGIKLSGRAEIVYRGHRVDFSPGTVLYLPKEESADIDYTTTFLEKGDGVCIFFDADGPMPKDPIVISEVDGEVERAFVRLLNLYIRSDKYTYADMMEAFWGLMAKLCRMGGEWGSTKSRERLSAAIEYMEEHPEEAFLDVGRLAKMSSMTEKYFRAAFKSCMGVSPLQYFHNCKTRYIRGLISRIDLSIAEIGRMSGFSDANYFSRFFKKHLGLSPREYRCYYCK